MSRLQGGRGGRLAALLLLTLAISARAEVKRLAVPLAWVNIPRSTNEEVKMQGTSDGVEGLRVIYTRLSGVESFDLYLAGGVYCSAIIEKGASLSLSCTNNLDGGMMTLTRFRGESIKLDAAWVEDESPPAAEPAERKKPARKTIPVPLPKEATKS